MALDASVGAEDGGPSVEVKTGPVRWGAAGGLRSLVEALAGTSGVAVEEETFPGTVHGFLRARNHVAAARRAVAAGADWLARTV